MKSQKRGGDINKHNAFKYILSIGYEIETDFLAKLTGGYDEEGEQFLFNTDSNTQNIHREKGDEDDEDDEDEEYDERLRKEEVMSIDAYNQNGKKDDTISFLVTNDMSSTRLSKKLKKLCCSDNNSTYCSEKMPSEIKNKLYKFYTENDFDTKTDKEYDIGFVFFEDSDCATFSDVEWVVTYYNPPRSENIILDTFKNLIENISRHLNSLEEIEGSLVINKIDFRDEDGNGKIAKTLPEKIIPNPVNRSLFRSPGLNLYYLQTDNNKNKLDVDTICPTYQMTFAANAEHIFQILKQLIYNKVISFDCYREEFKEKFEVIQKIEFCIDELISGYNQKETNPIYQISKTESNKTWIKQFKGYLGLIMYKIYIYYNNFVEKEKRNNAKGDKKIIYFKDSLFFNPRHSNYDFYVEAKKCLSEILSTAPQQEIPNIIRKIILQPIILNKLLLDDVSHVDEKAFSALTNDLEKTSEKYGNPYYSLDSYFQFFEEPVDDDSNLYEDDTIIFYDWFQYKGVDKVSTQMKIENNVVLVEIRNFQKLMSNYIFSSSSPELKNMIMNDTTCNKLEKCIMGINFGNLKNYFNISKLDSKLESKTSKTSNTSKPKTSKISKTSKTSKPKTSKISKTSNTSKTKRTKPKRTIKIRDTNTRNTRNSRNAINAIKTRTRNTRKK